MIRSPLRKYRALDAVQADRLHAAARADVDASPSEHLW
jgi:hypothetical protein